MAMLTVVQQEDGTQVLMMAVDADERQQLLEGEWIQAAVPEKQRGALVAIEVVALVPCEEYGDVVDAQLKIEVDGMRRRRANES